ncbi:penicillin-binding protein 2 [Aquimarina sp. MMG015]|uniref:penicillin-binding protein 2 n=1 Tax=unclassified Aquimarina TaxID=2627091 RepID=UPI000E54F98C|nr:MULTISPECIES: penicillin-binding protein 2 [unclassified Aquimarina]AXT57735.1 penicillin-binding protein 2 [Aquimarina sp. AD1]MBQ4805529.1 penicillin-binding protein 2 [Aquimarina sp. MMG015]RKN07174.1 penicillin-binding protein 2 [Aquimarina sp. AD1]
MRKLLLYLIIISTGVVFTARLFYLQIYNTSFAALSEDNAIKVLYDYPQRGAIYDRNGKLLVTNQPSYDVMVIPRELKPFDTLEFCSILKITKEKLVKQLKKARVYSPRVPSVVIPQLTKDEYAYLQEKMRKFDGFYIQKRSLRDYHTVNASNVLGYIAEVNDGLIRKDPYYLSGDLIGMQGVEKQYENQLRGIKGIKRIQKDRFNRDIGPYKNGKYDTLPVNGKDLTITIDEELQAYGQKLMENKRGGIVALDPATGEILTLITAPSYKPELLVGRKRSPNYTRLHYDSISRPLFDRGVKGEYPPGSPFKAITALIGLQEGVVDTKESFSCNHGFRYGKKAKLGCHSHRSPLSMIPGIAQSCNAYFANVYLRSINKYDTPQEGIDNWEKHVESFGLGNYLGNDLSSGSKGLIPNSKFYNRQYNYPKYKWYPTATISNAIGQGEVLATPIQLANMTAAIANRGYFYTPHIIKAIDGQPIEIENFTKPKYTTIDKEHFEPVIEGMHQVYVQGTAASLQVKDIEICGKTGTAENYTVIDGERMQLTDHSVFVAFAPKDNPKIALTVFIENGYWGARYAGKIASLMIEKYINQSISRTDLEDWVLTHSLEEEYAKPYSGEPFKINQ